MNVYVVHWNYTDNSGAEKFIAAFKTLPEAERMYSFFADHGDEGKKYAISEVPLFVGLA